MSEIAESGGAAVHGVVMNLSPVKESKKNTSVQYFHGTISDGRKSVRVVSFDPPLRLSLQLSRTKRSSVAVVNCQVKTGRGDSNVEIMATNRTKVEDSPRKFSLPSTSETANKEPIQEAECRARFSCQSTRDGDHESEGSVSSRESEKQGWERTA